MAVPEPATTPDHVLIWAASGGAGVPLRELLLVGLTAAAITYLLTSAVRVIAIRTLSLIHISEPTRPY